MTRITVIATLLLTACADQAQLVKVFIVAPDPIVVVQPAPVTPVSQQTVRVVVTDPPPQDLCTEAFRLANHTQWVNECGTSAEKEPLAILWTSKNGTPNAR